MRPARASLPRRGRISVRAERHTQRFIQAGCGIETATVTYPRGGEPAVASGFRGLAILKTAKSGFAGYIKDRLTTLKETHDRLLGTLGVGGMEIHRAKGVDYGARGGILWMRCSHAFAEHDSLSVQQTLYAMGKAALEAEPDISEIRLSMPNKHCNLVDLSAVRTGQSRTNLRADRRAAWLN